MSDLKNTKLMQLLPPNLRNDPDMIAVSSSLDERTKELVAEAEKLIMLGHIDNVTDENVLDHLLWQEHITVNEGAGLAETIEEKQNLIKNSTQLHQMKGTKEALERVLELLNMRGKITEWFEYGGDPGYFRVELLEVKSRGLSENNIRMLENLVNEYKNQRSWLETINIFLTGERGQTKLASSTYGGEEITVYPWRETEVEGHAQSKLSSGSQSVETLSVYPQ